MDSEKLTFQMQTYRRYLLGSKKKFGTARSLVHYRDYLKLYRDAKKQLIDYARLTTLIENASLKDVEEITRRVSVERFMKGRL